MNDWLSKQMEIVTKVNSNQAARIAALEAQNAELIAALDKLLKKHVELIESGDCGFWNPEDEAEVTHARAVLAKYKEAK